MARMFFRKVNEKLSRLQSDLHFFFFNKYFSFFVPNFIVLFSLEFVLSHKSTPVSFQFKAQSVT